MILSRFALRRARVCPSEASSRNRALRYRAFIYFVLFQTAVRFLAGLLLSLALFQTTGTEEMSKFQTRKQTKQHIYIYIYIV